MTYQNMTGNLGFPTWAALIGGAVVETLGLSSVQTAVTFWSWNDSKAKATPKAPVFLAILTGLFYLTTVLTVNALLDNAPAVSVLAKALLSSLSVCAGVILALRAGHSRRIREAELAKAERKQERAVLRAERRAGAVLSAAPLAQPGNNGRGHGIHQGESIR
jgi:pilus assembly protein TadC